MRNSFSANTTGKKVIAFRGTIKKFYEVFEVKYDVFEKQYNINNVWIERPLYMDHPNYVEPPAGYSADKDEQHFPYDTPRLMQCATAANEAALKWAKENPALEDGEDDGKNGKKSKKRGSTARRKSSVKPNSPTILEAEATQPGQTGKRGSIASASPQVQRIMTADGHSVELTAEQDDPAQKSKSFANPALERSQDKRNSKRGGLFSRSSSRKSRTSLRKNSGTNFGSVMNKRQKGVDTLMVDEDHDRFARVSDSDDDKRKSPPPAEYLSHSAKKAE